MQVNGKKMGYGQRRSGASNDINHRQNHNYQQQQNGDGAQSFEITNLTASFQQNTNFKGIDNKGMNNLSKGSKFIDIPSSSNHKENYDRDNDTFYNCNNEENNIIDVEGLTSNRFSVGNSMASSGNNRISNNQKTPNSPQIQHFQSESTVKTPLGM